MKILQRYILQELWVPFLLSFGTLSFIFMAGYLVRAANFIIGRGIPLLETFYVLILATPEMISYTAPTSVLTAVLIVFGGLSQNNEIRGMKASGVYPGQIMVPALLAGLVLSFFMFVFNDQIATHADFEMRKVTKRMLIEHPAALIEPGRFVKLSDSVVFLTKKREGTQMRDIVAYENEDENKPVRTIIAERGEIITNKEQAELKIRLYDGSVSDTQDANVQSIQFKSYEFPTMGQEDIRQLKKKPRNLTLAELLVRIPQVQSKKDKTELWSWFHHRIAFAFACFLFAFIGVPIAILVRRGEIVLSFGISMAATSIYYIFFVAAKTLSLQQMIPPVIAFWIPNALFLIFGFKLLKKSITA